MTIDANQNLYRIKLMEHNLFLTAEGSNLYWRAQNNAGSQQFKLVNGGGSSGGGSRNLGLKTVRQKSYASLLGNDFSDYGCYACCMLSMVWYYENSQTVTMQTLVNNRNVGAQFGNGITSAPYFSNSGAVALSEASARTTIYNEVMAGRPVYIQLKNHVSGNTHWVAATAVTGTAANQITVMDPYKGDGSAGTWTLAQLFAYREDNRAKYTYNGIIQKNKRYVAAIYITFQNVAVRFRTATPVYL